MGDQQCDDELGVKLRTQPDVAGDILMLKWWDQLRESGELLDVFPATAETPSGFFSLFTNPQIHLFYRADAQGMAVCMWFEPFMGNVALGMWARRDYRHRRWWDDLLVVLRTMFTAFPMVFFFTKRPHVIDSAVAVGFTAAGTIPYLYRGEPGHIAYLTREDFEAKYGVIGGNGQ